MPPDPAPKKQMERLLSPEDLAREKFGPTEGLAVVHKTTLDLAAHYANEFKLDPKDPEVTVLSVALAFARHKEFLLMQELARDLYERVLSAQGMSYGEALFRTAKSHAYRAVNDEISRLHSRASSYRKELKSLANRQDRSQD